MMFLFCFGHMGWAMMMMMMMGLCYSQVSYITRAYTLLTEKEMSA